MLKPSYQSQENAISPGSPSDTTSASLAPEFDNCAMQNLRDNPMSRILTYSLVSVDSLGVDE